MREFLRTRTMRQWTAVIAWIVLIGMFVGIDAYQGKYLVAVLEAVAYGLIFLAAAWWGSRTSSRA